MNIPSESGRGRARSLAFVVLVAVALASGVVGAAIDRMTLRSGARAGVFPDTGYHPLSSILRSPTDDERRRSRAQLATALGLSATQTKSVDSILDAHAEEFRQLRDDIRPRVEGLTNSVRNDVKKILTPEQRVLYQQVLGAQSAADSAGGVR